MGFLRLLLVVFCLCFLFSIHYTLAENTDYESISKIEYIEKKNIEPIQENKLTPPKISANDFYNSICFKCHAFNDFSPCDKTQKQWRQLIEDNSHAIFENISWETPIHKKQILQFLLENAGNCRGEGIGLWN